MCKSRTPAYRTNPLRFLHCLPGLHCSCLSSFQRKQSWVWSIFQEVFNSADCGSTTCCLSFFLPSVLTLKRHSLHSLIFLPKETEVGNCIPVPLLFGILNCNVFIANHHQGGVREYQNKHGGLGWHGSEVELRPLNQEVKILFPFGARVRVVGTIPV